MRKRFWFRLDRETTTKVQIDEICSIRDANERNSQTFCFFVVVWNRIYWMKKKKQWRVVEKRIWFTAGPEYNRMNKVVFLVDSFHGLAGDFRQTRQTSPSNENPIDKKKKHTTKYVESFYPVYSSKWHRSANLAKVNRRRERKPKQNNCHSSSAIENHSLQRFLSHEQTRRET